MYHLVGSAVEQRLERSSAKTDLIRRRWSFVVPGPATASSGASDVHWPRSLLDDAPVTLRRHPDAVSVHSLWPSAWTASLTWPSRLSHPHRRRSRHTTSSTSRARREKTRRSVVVSVGRPPINRPSSPFAQTRTHFVAGPPTLGPTVPVASGARCSLLTGVRGRRGRLLVPGTFPTCRAAHLPLFSLSPHLASLGLLLVHLDIPLALVLGLTIALLRPRSCSPGAVDDRSRTRRRLADDQEQVGDLLVALVDRDALLVLPPLPLPRRTSSDLVQARVDRAGRSPPSSVLISLALMVGRDALIPRPFSPSLTPPPSCSGPAPLRVDRRPWSSSTISSRPRPLCSPPSLLAALVADSGSSSPSQRSAMASTRQPRPLQIFQDPITSFDHPERSHMHPGLPSLSPLRPVRPAPSTREVVFDPPLTGPSRPSPRKMSQQSSSPPKALFQGRFNVISIPPPEAPAFITDSPQKRPAYSTFDTSRAPQPQRALFTTFQGTLSTDKENVGWLGDDLARLPRPDHAAKGSLKRALLEPAPIRDRPAKKAKLGEPTEVRIPSPAEMPAVEDNGNKPPHSYSMLIGMSILRAPNRRLTLAQIYRWISDSFEHYRSVDTGWQNSIRHNLSLNKAFVKQERPKDDPGKGNYWAIAPGFEGQFVKEKAGRRAPSLSIAAPMQSSTRDALQPLGPQRANVRGAGPTQTILSTTATAPLAPPAAADPSSDATIAASEIAAQDAGGGIEAQDRPTWSHTLQPSSSPPLINSSPPINRRRSAREATPPSVYVAPPALRSRQRKSMAVNDSGYYSSIDSSVRRPSGGPRRLTSEAELGRPTSSGRAEEEMARIRHSSYESPTKLRAIVRQPTPPLASSSPLRHLDHSLLLLPPLTPRTTFKMPPKPPRSISPNTSLRNHRDRMRELIGSPLKGMSCLQDERPWSPGLHLDDQYRVGTGIDLSRTFDVYSSSSPGEPVYTRELSPTTDDSPETRFRKRPRLDSPNVNILADITNHRVNAFAVPTTPALKFPFLRSPAFSASPSKSPMVKGGILARAENIFDDFFVDETSDVGGGSGILPDLEPVGGEEMGLKKANARPPLGRSSTSHL